MDLMANEIAKLTEAVRELSKENNELKISVKARDERTSELSSRLSQVRAREEALFEVIEKLISELKG